MQLSKETIIDIVSEMGFTLNYDQWDNKEWLRFKLKDELDEPDLRLIWYADIPTKNNFKSAATILFKAGQKAKLLQLKELIEL